VFVQPPPASSFAPPPPSPARVQTRGKTVKSKAARARVSKPKQTLPGRSAVKATESSAPDSTLMIGGLALVVLVLGDTIFLGFSARLLRAS
jgi:hypothetical protein